MSKKVAKFIKELEGFSGKAELYKLEPAIEQTSWVDDKVKKYDYVIVSAIVAPYSGPETYIFGATKDGEIANWSELNGSFRGALDHEQALKNAGYEVTV